MLDKNASRITCVIFSSYTTDPMNHERTDLLEDLLPADHELEKLPRLAVLAYAARCIQHVLPFIDRPRGWSGEQLASSVDFLAKYVQSVAEFHEMPDSYVLDRIQGAKAFGEMAAFDDKSFTDSVFEYVFQAVMAAAVATLPTNAFRIPSHIVHTHAVILYCYAAAQLAAEFGKGAVLEDIVHAMRNDYDNLAAASAKEGWTDSTNVSPRFFGKDQDKFFSCFISYSHADSAFASALHDIFVQRGVHCWHDKKQILPGDSILDSVDLGIRLWDKVLLCCSASSLRSWWVKDEVEKAIQKERRIYQEEGRTVLALIPLNLDGFLFSNDFQSGHKSFLCSRLAPDFTNWNGQTDKFGRQVELLINGLRVDGGTRARPPQKC